MGYISIFTPPSSPQCLGCTLRFLSRLWCRVVQIHWTRPPYDTGQRPNARSRLPAASPRGDHLRRLPGSKSEGQVSIQQKSPCALARLQRFFGTGGCGSTGKKKRKKDPYDKVAKVPGLLLLVWAVGWVGDLCWVSKNSKMSERVKKLLVGRWDRACQRWAVKLEPRWARRAETRAGTATPPCSGGSCTTNHHHDDPLMWQASERQ